MKFFKRVFAMILMMIMVSGILPFTTIPANATTNHSVDEAVVWIKARANEEWWQDVDGSYGCQCVDLIMAYYEYLVGYRVGGNACDYWTNSLPSGWYRDYIPSPGSIIVWKENAYAGNGWSTGAYGHVGLVYAVSGSTVYTVESNVSSPYDGGSNSCAKYRERNPQNVIYIHPDFKSAHVHSYSSSVTKNPTCTAAGIRTYTCSCASSYTEMIAAVGHKWNSGEVVTAPGCASEGVKEYTCTVCGETYTSAISSTGHTSVKDEAVAATCLTDGLTEGSHCSVCGAIIKPQEKVPALGHNYILATGVAQCGSVKATYKCIRCDNYYEEIVHETVYSDWSEAKPENITEENIESKTQYRSAKKSKTQSSSASMSGWTKYDTQITGWTNWSAWQNSAVSSSSSREVKTQHISPTYKTVWNYNRSTNGSYSTYALGYYGPNSNQYITLDYRLTVVGYIDGYAHYGSYDGGYGSYLKNFWWNETSSQQLATEGYTQYSYRDAVYTYYFYKWEDFSDWKDEEISADDDTNVETRVLYRYKITPNAHTFEEEWAYDSEAHWHVCNNCAVKDNISFHEYDNDQDKDCNVCGYIREVKIPVSESEPQIVVESKKSLAGNAFAISVNIKNNPGFMYLELTPNYSSELTLISVENGELISDLTTGKQYVWVADNNISDDGLLMKFTFTTTDNVNPGSYDVGFIVRGCVNYDEQNVDISVVNGMIEILDFTYGDANGDNAINGQDVVRIKKYLANYDYDTETSTVEINAGGDANGDGMISGQDVVRIKKYLANYDYEAGTSSIVLGPQN